ncbi:conserved hypothetical protein [Beutenbergia cavernae DSM 12333]|uniref:Uncharacterized protein n=1 Tax=Beutenbergia cavernae (strain ATCC BAA-8 / DSM 12333 / CCUG 43141 / JCM 11478 / NBRC 16432 / NCIMB 13614 / HKI 0122) TaxID=471853 RepID=C5C678_BEUC1|nr:hypothetical protein [Beutenbergia cavernae]ACQ80284.1 conserved hypothetical protein [Beutenbergia cavernae DSM 12333]
MFVVTADQRGSRRGTDLVEEALAELAALVPEPTVLRPFARTAGDELQGVLADAEATVTVALHLQRRATWSVGIGVGAGTLGADTRSSTGDAFFRARDAVERAKGRTVPVPLALAAGDAGAAVGTETVPAPEVEALLHLLAALVRDRSDATWRVLDRLAEPGATGKDAAAALAITPQAVSAHRRDALWDTEQVARRAVATLLGALPDASA